MVYVLRRILRLGNFKAGVKNVCTLLCYVFVRKRVAKKGYQTGNARIFNIGLVMDSWWILLFGPQSISYLRLVWLRLIYVIIVYRFIRKTNQIFRSFVTKSQELIRAKLATNRHNDKELDFNASKYDIRTDHTFNKF